MADITMCVNKTCPNKNSCYRQKAIPNNYHQSMAKFEYTSSVNGEFYCDNFWPIGIEEKK
jgi:hypothetical protein